MWLEFASVVTILCVMLFAPGFVVLRAFNLSRSWSFCLAPIISIALLCIFGMLYAFVGVTASPLSMLLPCLLLPLLLFLLTKNKIKPCSFPRIDWPLIGAYVVAGMAVGLYLFINPLPNLDSLFQEYDVKQHLNLIQSFADAGRYSSLGVNSYLSTADQAIDPNLCSSFYPAAWHIICALAVSVCGSNVPLVINASMFVFCCLVYPLSFLAFFQAIFPTNKRVKYLGCLVSLAFVAFPWDLLIFGPLYPNVAGFTTVPATMALVILLLEQKNRADRAKFIALLGFAVIGQALLHPNTLFTCAVILIPYCVYRIKLACEQKEVSKRKQLFACVGFIVLCVAIWLVCYKLPFLQEIVSHIWPPYAGRRLQALVDIATQTYTMPFFFEMAAQFTLGALVIIGLVKALYSKQWRWIGCSYLLACFICMENAVRSDELKQILAGFWYTDPMRIAVVAVLAATPLAAIGLTWVFNAVLSAVQAYNDKHKKPTHPRIVVTALAGIFLVLNFMPAFDLPGNHLTWTNEQKEQVEKGEDPPLNQRTTFGDYLAIFKSTYTHEAPLSTEERGFLHKVDELVGGESLVINNPMDGSFLAYGTLGLRVYYRDFVGFDDTNESPQSKLIRTQLNNYASNAAVQDAVTSIGARYVMILSECGSDTSFINLRCDYNQSTFSGISAITNDTPGFTCILNQDGMQLFEINDSNND